ncbi:hypothetical protein FQA39_LY10361 [Lamprigera yunnana]|nr:hypothetical protein FQA39_LY10361 [Lamprigera yunnana]
MSASKTHGFKVDMACEGCSNTIRKVLERMKGQGVDNIDIDLKSQMVTVTSSLMSEELLAIIEKTGKKTEFMWTR